jgi:hypothetical protein
MKLERMARSSLCRLNQLNKLPIRPRQLQRARAHLRRAERIADFVTQVAAGARKVFASGGSVAVPGRPAKGSGPKAAHS